MPVRMLYARIYVDKNHVVHALARKQDPPHTPHPNLDNSSTLCRWSVCQCLRVCVAGSQEGALRRGPAQTWVCP